jgi:hypothetical protein
MLKTKYTELTADLWGSDEASKLTNEGARAIEELVLMLAEARAAFDMLYETPDRDTVMMTSGVMEARIRNLLKLEM